MLVQCYTGICARNTTVEKVLQNDEVKILWNFKIQTDKNLLHSISNITVVERSRCG